MAAPARPEAIRDVNTRYHDVAADDYDAKWGISFGDEGRRQVVTKLSKALGGAPGHFPRALEVGAGTGYFTLNLMRAGVVGSAVCTDISPGMLTVLAANAHRLGLEVRTVVGDAERLGLEAGSFDLVFGHAVLHHLPDLAAAFAGFHRLLAPGGRLAFAGEPSRNGDRLAAVPKRGAAALAPLWRRAIGATAVTQAHPHTQAQAQAHTHDAEPDAAGPRHDFLEWAVDVHSFSPDDLRHFARAAGFEDVCVRGEELLGSWFGWTNRTLEGSAQPETVPFLWQRYAYHGYLVLQELDRRLLEGRLPPAWFYNLLLSARRTER